jgi:hypothetical protein
LLGWDKYEEWSKLLEKFASKLEKPYLNPCKMMKSGSFKDFP